MPVKYVAGISATGKFYNINNFCEREANSWPELIIAAYYN